MSDAFISYRRKPSAALAQLVQEKLKNQHHIDAYVDTTRSDSTRVQFHGRLMAAIADAPTFICLLGDSTLESEWVRKEIQQAYDLRKHCIPVFQESYSPPSNSNAAIEYLLSFDGVHIFDLKNVFVDNSIEDIAQLVIRQRRPMPRSWLVAGLLSLLVGLGLLAFLLLRDQDSAQATPPPTQAAQLPSDTPNPATTRTLAPSFTQTQPPSLTPPQASATLSVEEIAQATMNDLSAATATRQAQWEREATNIALPLTQIAQATQAIQTQQVQDMAEAIAVDTRVAELQATQTTWTPTPSNTPTTTMSFTPRPSNTPTATPTRTPSPTRTQTPTFTLTSTNTSTHTPIPTDTPSITARPILFGFQGNPVTANDQWDPITGEFDEVTMVLVPVGCFLMGSEDGASDERPIHEQCFDKPFWIDKYEVTNSLYGGPSSYPECSANSSEPDQPRTCLNWFEALEYCQSRGPQFSLPSEAEWEYAARGPDNWIYPWGNTFIAANAVFSDNSDGQTALVGSRPAGASWVGAQDMAGNLWEWTSSLYQPYPYDRGDGRENLDNTANMRVARSGSIFYNRDLLPSTIRGRNYPNEAYNDHGFRCVRTYN